MHIDNPRPENSWSPRRDERLFLPKSANIRQIYLRCPYLLDFRLACATLSLTHVDLLECPIDFAMEFLLKCPNLIDFHCRIPVYPSKIKNPRTMLASPLVLNHLSTFTWFTNPTLDCISQWDIVLFEHIQFPALKTFNWWVGHGVYYLDLIANDATIVFLSRFPHSLTTLELGGIDYNPFEETFDHFLPLTGVTQLRLSHCEYRFVEQTISALSRRADGRSILFPKLTSLIIDYRVIGGRTPPWVMFRAECGIKLAQIVRSRIGLIDEFKLVVGGAQLTRRWNEGSWQAVREVMRDELDLVIIENGFPVVVI
ncbi:hypothetical protein AGABI1DRAFT_126395 [Agaricus bisporus var. burnettii JB137-S8]|uniref:F-box domain-containing protein n=1 Tax=Agaricus bisporus var. burnettii (strain JB137-S8 / ATCC MYA-4627 / FGSC 10392) TaxID=597362 RepID=K5XFN8_AGABU|nr:uncharacterized protein AGABI1DRAFT_126395 [Agaricus bisporus var. burnettii JB137-S8]EKM82047.1 hypothetical protein AGABI1DRAFT_126395 [Agaricus bisporus var. burnettii JB137-S8]